MLVTVINVKDLISIVIPIYNSEKTLCRCLDSLISQIYTKIEIVLVDNGSKDKSLAICRDYAKKDNRVKVYIQTDGNQGAARNLGISKSKGNYLMFVDSDDYVTKEFCIYALRTIKQFKSDIAIFNYFIDLNNSITQQKIFSKEDNGVISKEKVLKSLTKESFMWNKIYRKTLFQNIIFPENEKFEDIATTYKLIEEANNISYLNKSLYFYVHNSQSTVNNSQNFDDYLINSLDLYSFIKKKYPKVCKNIEIQEWLVELALFYYVKGTTENKSLKKRALNIINSNNITPKRLPVKGKIILFIIRWLPLISGALLKIKKIIKN